MKAKIALALVTLTAAIPLWAQNHNPDFATVPEPSTLALFGSTAIAIMILRKFTK